MDGKSEDKVPMNWTTTSNFSETLIAGKFMVSKVPLDDRYDSQLWDESKYKPQDLVEYVKTTFKKTCGLWVDTTTSDRFFSKDLVVSLGLEFAKVSCPNYFPFPTKEKVREFNKVVKDFFMRGNNKYNAVVAVNCLDGYNTSGFYIISYLIECLNFPAGKAIGNFKSARPPGIDEDFVSELFQRYHKDQPRNANFKRKYESFNNNFVSHKNGDDSENGQQSKILKADIKNEKIKKEEEDTDILSLFHVLQDHEINGFLEVIRRRTMYRPHNIFFDAKETLELVIPVSKSVPHIQIYYNGISEVKGKTIPWYICMRYDGGLDEPIIKIYDSLNRIKSLADLELSFRDYLNVLYPFKHKYEYPVTHVPAKNPIDCGLYACAFFTSLTYNKDPTLEYYFHENLRPILKYIIEQKELVTFTSNYQEVQQIPVGYKAEDMLMERQETRGTQLQTLDYGAPSTSGIKLPDPMIDVKPIIRPVVERSTSSASNGNRSDSDSRCSASERRSTKRNDVGDLKKILTMLKPHLKLVEPQKKAELETVVKKYMYNSIFDEFLGTIPTVLTREKLELLKKHKYCVSWKADGIRYLMYVVRKNEIYLIDRNNDYFKLVTKYFIPKNNFPDLHLENTLLDGEMVLDIKDKKLEMRYLVFDVIVFGSQFVREDKFLTSGSNKEKNRYYCVRTAISKTYNDQTLDRDQPFYIYHKSFYYTTDLQKILNVTKELPHSHDGLIFLKESEKYQPGVDNLQFMWMPPNRLTIDFHCSNGKLLLRKEDREDSKLVEYATIKSASKYFANFNEIVECFYFENEWAYLRKRPDKKIPNCINRVDDILKLSENPITKRELLDLFSEQI